MEYIPDPFEIGEARVEAFLASQQFDGKTLICPNCKQRRPISEWQTMSPDPYDVGICGDCFWNSDFGKRIEAERQDESKHL